MNQKYKLLFDGFHFLFAKKSNIQVSLLAYTSKATFDNV